jgi:hypothetical protein
MLLFSGRFRGLLDAIFTIEALDAARGIDQALRPSVKGMAFRADLDMKLFEGRAGLEGVAAGAGDCAAAVFGMDSRFHCLSVSLPSFVKDTIAGDLAQLTV